MPATIVANKDNENTGQILNNNHNVYNEKGNNTGNNDHGEYIHSNYLLQSILPLALFSY